MSNTSPIEHASPSGLGTTLTRCDLCHSTELSLVMDATQGNGSILICNNCRLMQVSPPLSAEALDSFYDDTFANDPGCQLRAGSNFPPDKDRKKEEVLAENWGIKIIKRYVNPRAKNILDLRCRTGSLTYLLQEEGAEVIGVEPFGGNANYAREMRGLSNIVDLPFSRFHQFPLPRDEYYDVVNILPHHVLAHVLSPRILLEQIYKSLKPGGYVFLDEKDVLHPVRHKKQSALDSGPAHQYHLTLATTTRYIRSVGFKIIESEIDKQRCSDFRHIRIVAQKPEGSTPTSAFSWQTDLEKFSSVRAIHRRLWWLERTWKLRLVRVKIKKKSQRSLQKFGF